MYLHLGDDTIISGDNIIAIINLDEPVSEVLKELIENAEVDNILHAVGSNEKKKAIVLCDDCCYLSPISSNTLFKRAIHFRKED
ncbi:MAG: DUF370 domain-containing protein [Syntrophomonadaceae bacterium]|nr:DUF370 domain-containing protein [Syntrophomonadaceae bacterium]